MSKQQSPRKQDLDFVGSSKKDLAAFPKSARARIGYQLYRLELGQWPQDFKPMPTVGAGAYEIRVSADNNQYRVIYVAKFEEGVYVLHVFQKTTREIEQKDIDLAKERYNQVKRQRAP